ncbi:N-acetylmuramoyl-L-alanine amidase [Cochlodiniinecator piscidefendens]|uniref:N-acetylmuramoyl-L-alanine amidase n=1 Tax=Cochlodiniinecator piscidefendens TaxID=2715756 RepID=UPI001407FE09|nr:N-acetylmuramoyl-L-alanine amidase [Cochlodiniinecator piscidefendens]
MIYQGKKRYPLTEVVLHTSATTSDWWKGKDVNEMQDEIRRWHVEDRGWRDIGYARVFSPDGRMALGRSIYSIGAHVKGRNRGTIGICMIPIKTITKMGIVTDYYTDDQIYAVKHYIKELSELTEIKKGSGHNDYANKLCPDFKVRSEDWL